MSHKHRDKRTLMRFYVNKRLTESLNTYYEEMEASAEYLENRKAENVVRKM